MTIHAKADHAQYPQSGGGHAGLAPLRARFERFHLAVFDDLAGETSKETLISFSALLAEDTHQLDHWLASQGRRTDGPDEILDEKTRCSFLLGHMAHRLCYALAALALDRRFGLSLPDPHHLAFHTWDESWSHEDEHGVVQSGIVLHADPVVGSGQVIDTDGWSDDERVTQCRSAIIDVFAPLIARLKILTGLGTAAQWRIVADMASASFLYAAKEIDETERGMALGRLLIHGEKTPLTNRQVGYLQVFATDDPTEPDWFLERGGCCRWYTTQKPVDYCSTCVLLKREARAKKLGAYLAELRAERRAAEAESAP